jgi:hypothetical protein
MLIKMDQITGAISNEAAPADDVGVTCPCVRVEVIPSDDVINPAIVVVAEVDSGLSGETSDIVSVTVELEVVDELPHPRLTIEKFPLSWNVSPTCQTESSTVTT